MQVDRILGYPEYKLHSDSRLQFRDGPYARAWLDGRDPLYTMYYRLQNQRVAGRKEFYETAFVLDRLAPELRQAHSVHELVCGHGMLGAFATVLHPGIRRVIQVDLKRPECYDRIRELLALDYPFVKTRTRFEQKDLRKLHDLPNDSLAIGVHCCGRLTDLVAETARRSNSSFVVVPCCEARELLPNRTMRREVHGRDLPRVLGEVRMHRWRSWGYDVDLRYLPEAVTARGRMFVAHPPRA